MSFDDIMNSGEMQPRCSRDAAEIMAASIDDIMAGAGWGDASYVRDCGVGVRRRSAAGRRGGDQARRGRGGGDGHADTEVERARTRRRHLFFCEHISFFCRSRGTYDV